MNELFQWIANFIKDTKPWALVLPWERAVRVRFGRWVRIWEPGFHLRIPFFDNVLPVNTRLRVAAVPSQTITTSDGKALTIAANLGFRVTDPLAAMLLLQQPDATCAALVQSEFARLVIGKTLVQIVPHEVEDGALAALRDRYGAAIMFDWVRIIDFAAVRTFRLIQDNWRPATGHQDMQ